MKDLADLPAPDPDDTPLRFGKYKGRTPRDVAKDDPQYIVWMHANVLPAPCSRDLALECEDDPDQDCDTGFDDLDDHWDIS